MAHGGYGKRRAAAERKKPAGQRRPKALTVDKKSKTNKPKAVSLKNQIRSIERMLRKELPDDVKEAQEKKIRRLEKQQRVSAGQAEEADIADQLSKLKEDLEYVRVKLLYNQIVYVYLTAAKIVINQLVSEIKLQFFPKTEKYVPLFIGASGKDLEETGSEDDGLLDQSDDDFFLHGSSSDEADADDEWTDKSARSEQASSASGKAASGMSSDDRNQRQISARALMPPPGPSGKPFSTSLKNKSRFAGSSGKKSYNKAEISTSSNTSSSIGRSSFRKRGPMDSTTGNSGNQSSNSDARKPKRKRRPKKKKQQES
ncbi:hypothetical protein DH2020_004794 [Rehmannia glutinosa]|uniref:rRNA-processing protein efg1 n=1 Tax=Rehmannia glutinosa TaxID=99300 RepID=A0ABR0XQP6_REHGL